MVKIPTKICELDSPPQVRWTPAPCYTLQNICTEDEIDFFKESFEYNIHGYRAAPIYESIGNLWIGPVWFKSEQNVTSLLNHAVTIAN